jgi:chemotaxis protein methyltransferase CheR
MSLDAALEAAVDEVAGLLNTRIGLRPEPILRGRLRRALRDEALAHGHDPQAHVSILRSQQDALQRLLNRVTVQETGFFRHPEHFEVLARDVLPGLPEPVTIWSAGCANGQEAYGLAMVLEEQRVAGSVIATDLSTTALHRTAAVCYSAREVTGLSPARIARHLTATAPVRHRADRRHLRAERIRAVTAASAMPAEGHAIIVTASAGCVVEPDATTDELLSTAYSPPYAAKHAGRNLVMASRGPVSDAN